MESQSNNLYVFTTFSKHTHFEYVSLLVCKTYAISAQNKWLEIQCHSNKINIQTANVFEWWNWKYTPTDILETKESSRVYYEGARCLRNVEI